MTWKSWVLPTRQTAGVPALSTAASTSSFAAERPARLVMPKAVKVARVCRARGEEVAVGRVGAGPAALDIIEAERVERLRDLLLVGDREVARPASAGRRAAWCRRGRGARGSFQTAPEALRRSPARSPAGAPAPAAPGRPPGGRFAPPAAGSRRCRGERGSFQGLQLGGVEIGPDMRSRPLSDPCLDHPKLDRRPRRPWLSSRRRRRTSGPSSASPISPRSR